jgi:hypothetical protein
LRVAAENPQISQVLIIVGFCIVVKFQRAIERSRGAQRMAESAALLVDKIIPAQPVCQWVLSFPYPLRFLITSRAAIMGRGLGIGGSSFFAREVHPPWRREFPRRQRACRQRDSRSSDTVQIPFRSPVRHDA